MPTPIPAPVASPIPTPVPLTPKPTPPVDTISLEKVEILYEALNHDETGKPNAFTVSVLERIKQIEEDIAALPSYSTYCMTPSQGEISYLQAIDRPVSTCATSQPNEDSVINYFYAEYLGDTSLQESFESEC